MRVILVDDHTLFRTGLRSFLETDPEIRVVAEASSAPEARTILAACTCDVVLVDLNLGNSDGVSLIRESLESRPDLRMLVVSMDTQGSEPGRPCWPVRAAIS